MFDNEKIYVKELKTVICSENRAGKKVYNPVRSFYGLSASVYGKIANCYFGGSLPGKGYAVTQPMKSLKTVFAENCFYDSSCISYEIPGAKATEPDSINTLEQLNQGRKALSERLLNVELSGWISNGNHPVLVRNITKNYKTKGDGTKENPYIIRSADDFIEFTNNINNLVTYKGKYFLQIADIDLSTRTDYIGANGSGYPYVFCGFYDGGGHTVNVALDITDKSYDNTVFPYVEGTVVNLGITGSVASGGKYISGFVRSVRHTGLVANCYSLVKISTNLQTETSYELRYNVSGESKISFDDAEYYLKPGSVLYFPRKLVTNKFTQEVLSPCRSISIYFDTEFSLSDRMFVCDMQGNEEIGNLFSKMHSTWLSRKSKYYLECMSHIYEIISKLSKPTGKYLPKDKYLMIEKGIEYLFENCFNKDVDVYYPAELCGISYTYFKQLFIQKFNRPPKQYIMITRMKRALELLETSNFSVAQIAELCGFDSVYYFSRAFKKYYGVSPKNYNK